MKKQNIERIEFRRENNLRIRLNFLIIFQLRLSLRKCFNAYEGGRASRIPLARKFWISLKKTGN